MLGLIFPLNVLGFFLSQLYYIETTLVPPYCSDSNGLITVLSNIQTIQVTHLHKGKGIFTCYRGTQLNNVTNCLVNRSSNKLSKCNTLRRSTLYESELKNTKINLKLNFVFNIALGRYLLWHSLIGFGDKHNKIHTTIMHKLNESFIYIILPQIFTWYSPLHT